MPDSKIGPVVESLRKNQFTVLNELAPYVNRSKELIRTPVVGESGVNSKKNVRAEGVLLPLRKATSGHSASV